MDGLLAALAFAALSATHLPANVVVDAELGAVVRTMFATSAAFRAQCRELQQRPQVRVHLRLDRNGPPKNRRPSRAEGEMRRYQHGHIAATLKFWSTKSAVELIAHEIEHVLEYADGVDFRAQSAQRGRGVWMPFAGHYETERATVRGQQVAQEVARARE